MPELQRWVEKREVLKSARADRIRTKMRNKEEERNRDSRLVELRFEKQVEIRQAAARELEELEELVELVDAERLLPESQSVVVQAVRPPASLARAQVRLGKPLQDVDRETSSLILDSLPRSLRGK